MLSLSTISAYGHRPPNSARGRRAWLRRWLQRLLSLGMLLGGILWGIPAPSLAAPAPEAAPEAADVSLQPNVSDIPSETISQFVKAYLAVVKLVDRQEPELQRAETEAESLQLQREVQRQAFTLIAEAGLTQAQYWQLLGLANSDADFREQVLAQVEEARLQSSR